MAIPAVMNLLTCSIGWLLATVLVQTLHVSALIREQATALWLMLLVPTIGLSGLTDCGKIGIGLA